MARRSRVPLRAAFFLVVLAVLLSVMAVMLDPGVLGASGDVLRRSGSAVDGNWVLLAAVGFPALFGNLHYVWIGILTHYTLDLLGNQYGMGVVYPLPGFYDIPVGVNVDSYWADAVTLLVTAAELGVVYLLIETGLGAHLASPDLPDLLRAITMS